jgi:hypothetical protein
MSTQPDETEIERQLVEEIRLFCGPPLSAFLLAGYGREEDVRCRTFRVTARNARHSAERQLVQICHDGWTELPRGREPLVWAVLLRELFESQPGSRDLLVYHRQVLEALGWENTVEGRALVQRALGKYVDMTLVVSALRQSPSTGEYFTYVHRLHPIVESQTVLAGEGGVVDEDASFGVEFSETFCAGLVSGGLYGTEWIEMIAGSP